jgi:hypothetical protein
MGIIMHLILESGFLHETTFSVTSLSEGQVDKQVKMSNPACFFSKVSRNVDQHLTPHICCYCGLNDRTAVSILMLWDAFFSISFYGRPFGSNSHGYLIGHGLKLT